jgi:hypothetical protein
VKAWRRFAVSGRSIGHANTHTLKCKHGQTQRTKTCRWRPATCPAAATRPAASCGTPRRATAAAAPCPAGCEDGLICEWVRAGWVSGGCGSEAEPEPEPEILIILEENPKDNYIIANQQIESKYSMHDFLCFLNIDSISRGRGVEAQQKKPIPFPCITHRRKTHLSCASMAARLSER